MNPQQQKRCQDLAEKYAPKPSAFENNHGSMVSPNGVTKEKRAAFTAGYRAALADCEALHKKSEQLEVAIEALDDIATYDEHLDGIAAFSMQQLSKKTLATLKGGGVNG